MAGVERKVFSRRQFVALGGAAAVATALTACGGDVAPTATSAGSTTSTTKVATAAGGNAITNVSASTVPTAFSVSTSAPPAAAPTSAASAVTGAGTGTAAPSMAGAFDWQKYKGKELRVFFPLSPSREAIKKNIGEFEKLTGIKTTLEELPEVQARQKLLVEFTAGNSTVDVFVSSLHQERLQFAKNGYYLPLNEMLADPKLTAPDYDFNDFFQGSKDICTVNDKIVGMPESMDTNCTYYRKDLLDTAGLKPPTNMDELEAVAKKLHNPPTMYGFVARGQKTQNATQIDPYLRNFGGGYFDKAGKPILDSDGNVKAVDFYAGMLKKYGPPGVTNFSWPESSMLFQQGRVALYTDGVSFAAPFEDKTKSMVAGKMGYGIFPAGPAGNFPPLYGNSWSIYANSKNKEAAWYFCQWATSKLNILRVLQSGTSVGRASAWADPKSRAESALPAEFFDTTFAMLKISVPGLAPVINVPESRDIVSVGVIDVINGQDAKTVMMRVNTEFTALVNKEKMG